MQKNDIVEFCNPLPDEIGLTMRILEINGDRIFVEYQVNLPIKPTAIVMLSDVRTVTPCK